MLEELQKRHDELLANKPAGMSEVDFAQHIADHKSTCAFCNEDIDISSQEGGDMDKEFTQEDIDAAVKEATAPLQAELDKIKSKAAEGEIDARVAEAEAAGEAKVADIQTKLDEAVNAKGAAESELANVLAYLEQEETVKAEAERKESLKAERRQALVENTNMNEQYIDENIDRFVAQDEEQFNAFLEDMKAHSVKASQEEGEGEGEGEGQPEGASLDTAMDSTRTHKSGKTDIRGDISNLVAGRKHGYNVKRI